MSFDWRAGYPTVRLPVFARNVVATSHPLAAQVGLSLLQRGGNAVDAAVGAAAAMTILEPCSNGLGSDAFCILWDGRELFGLNASGRAPAAWTPDYFRKKYGAGARQPPQRGWDSVTVPGAVAGWVELSRRFGKLSFEDLLAPAIDIAERGYAVPVVVQEKWAAALPELKDQPGFADTFMPGGRAPSVGERFAFPGAARALKQIAQTQGSAFYGGEIAAAAAAHAAQHGGAMRVEDFAAYKPEWVVPIGLEVYGYRLHQIPPNGQGIAALASVLYVGRRKVVDRGPHSIPLVALGIPPILVNAYVGVLQVDPDLTDAARGMGMTGWQVLRKVEIPVALPLIMLGLRTAAIFIVATATIAAEIGVGGLGRYIIDGLSQENYGEVAGGAVLVVILSVLVQVIFVALRRLVVPAPLRMQAREDG